jgi:hypothetical protein
MLDKLESSSGAIPETRTSVPEAPRSAYERINGIGGRIRTVLSNLQSLRSAANTEQVTEIDNVEVRAEQLAALAQQASMRKKEAEHVSRQLAHQVQQAQPKSAPNRDWTAFRNEMKDEARIDTIRSIKKIFSTIQPLRYGDSPPDFYTNLEMVFDYQEGELGRVIAQSEERFNGKFGEEIINTIKDNLKIQLLPRVISEAEKVLTKNGQIEMPEDYWATEQGEGLHGALESYFDHKLDGIQPASDDEIGTDDVPVV